MPMLIVVLLIEILGKLDLAIENYTTAIKLYPE